MKIWIPINIFKIKNLKEIESNLIKYEYYVIQYFFI
jgi:hypothetical protein